MKLIAVILIVIFITVPCSATESYLLEQYEATGIESVFDVESEVFPKFDSKKIATDLSSGKGFDTGSLLRKILEFFMGEFKNNFRVFALLIGVGFLTGFLHNMQTSFGGEGVSYCGEMVGYLIFSGILCASFYGLIEPAKEMIENVSVLIASTIPILITILTMCGGVVSSSLLSGVLITLVNIITPIVNTFLIPLILSTFSLAVASNLSDKIKITHAIESLNKFIKWALLFFMAIFAGVFGVYGLSGSAIDASAGKAIRFAIGSGIPLVGGVASDSLETVIATLSATRNLIGTIGMCTVVAVASVPIIKTAVLMWMFRLCCAVVQPFATPRVTTLLSQTTECITSVFAILISVCLMFVGALGVLLITGNFIVR